MNGFDGTFVVSVLLQALQILVSTSLILNGLSISLPFVPLLSSESPLPGFSSSNISNIPCRSSNGQFCWYAFRLNFQNYLNNFTGLVLIVFLFQFFC